MSLHINNLVGFGAGGVSGTQPVFQSVSTIAAGDGVSNINVNYPASIAAGNLLLMALGGSDGAAGVMIFTTPSGWTLINSITGTNARRFSFYRKIATGSESGTLAVTYGQVNGTACVGQMARYTTPGQLTVVEGAGTAGFTTSTSPAPASITSTDVSRLAVACIYYTNTSTCTAITGMSGGTWSESAAEQTSSSQSLDWQHAGLPTATTLSGGSATLGSSTGWAVHSLAILPG